MDPELRAYLEGMEARIGERVETKGRRTKTGPTGREILAQGFGRRPMPWVRVRESSKRPEGPREARLNRR